MRKIVFTIIISTLLLTGELVTGAGAFQNTKIRGIGDAGSDADVKLECLNCHSTMTPDVVEEWSESKHGLDNVKCYVCHGEKTSDAFIAKPQKERCRACHSYQVKTLSESKMNGTSCGNCHPVHQFSSKIARESGTCADCHKVQEELYKGSAMEKKGVLCSNCHFHVDFQGISSHSFKVEKQNCAGCHDSAQIERLDAIQSEIKSLLLEAKKDANKQVEISIIENDGSIGFHNPEKANQMLSISLKSSSPGSRTGLIIFAAGLIIFLMTALLLVMIRRGRDKR